MFTGLVEGVGRVARIERKGPDAILGVRPSWDPTQSVLGESVAVNGACLTVTRFDAQGFDLDVSAESLGRTTLGGLKVGSLVNLERALALGDRLGGHLVSGHIDCVGRLSARHELGSSVRLFIEIPAEHLRFVVEKGSVAVDGVSLTVNRLEGRGFELNIIPHTMGQTTLKVAKVGDSVNIETDLIGKYVARLLEPAAEGREPAQGGLRAEDLARMGY